MNKDWKDELMDEFIKWTERSEKEEKRKIKVGKMCKEIRVRIEGY